MTGTIRAGPEHGCAPVCVRGARRFDGSSPRRPKTKKAETVAPRRTRRKLPSLYGRMFRRRGELVRTALYRHQFGVVLDEEEWAQAICDVLVFSPHGCDIETFMRLADACGLDIDTAEAMEAIHAAERIRSRKLYMPMRADTVGGCSR